MTESSANDLDLIVTECFPATSEVVVTKPTKKKVVKLASVRKEKKFRVVSPRNIAKGLALGYVKETEEPLDNGFFLMSKEVG